MNFANTLNSVCVWCTRTLLWRFDNRLTQGEFYQYICVNVLSQIQNANSQQRRPQQAQSERSVPNP
jgi:hypothetical protein